MIPARIEMLCKKNSISSKVMLTETPFWVEVVDGLGCAFERIKELAAEKPAYYFVKSLNMYKVLASVDSTKGKKARVACLVHTTGRSPRGGDE
jgi:hypothetical protein